MKINFLPILFVSLLWWSCGSSGQNRTDDDDEKDSSVVEVTLQQFETMEMEVAGLQRQDFDILVKASGKIDVPPGSRAKVSSFMDGYIKTTSLLIGDRVSKGQALVTLENPEYISLQQEYLEVANQLTYLKSEYERQKTLYDENIASEKRFLEAESDYKKVKAAYDGARKRLQMLNIDPASAEKGNMVSAITIYSPLSGEISAINANLGMAVTPTDVIMEIIDTKALHLELSVYEKDFFLVKEGQAIQFSIPQVSDRVFASKVSLRGRSVERENRIVNVYGTINDTIKHEFIAGMFVEAAIAADSKSVLCVPYSAVIAEEGSNFLLVLESEDEAVMRFRKTLVNIGDRNGEWTEILPDNNVHENTVILAKGVYDVY